MNATIVLNYNDATTVIAFLKRAEKNAALGELVVVDNCSTDDSWEVLKAYQSERVYVIQAEANKGYAAGNNVGILYAIKRFPNLSNIIISNPDIHISKKDTEQILEAIDNGYDMATGLIFNYDTDSRKKRLASNFAWRIPSYWDMLTNCFLGWYKFRRKVLQSNIYFELSDFQGNPYLQVEAVPGCFFAVKKSTFERIGFFDEDTFLFEEETILGWKLLHAKKKVCVVQSATVLHENSTSIKKSIKSRRKSQRILHDSEVVYLKKYLMCSNLQILFFSFAFHLGLLEHEIISQIVKFKTL